MVSIVCRAKSATCELICVENGRFHRLSDNVQKSSRRVSFPPPVAVPALYLRVSRVMFATLRSLPSNSSLAYLFAFSSSYFQKVLDILFPIKVFSFNIGKWNISVFSVVCKRAFRYVELAAYRIAIQPVFHRRTFRLLQQPFCDTCQYFYPRKQILNSPFFNTNQFFHGYLIRSTIYAKVDIKTAPHYPLTRYVLL